jgi:hypothetical protein
VRELEYRGPDRCRPTSRWTPARVALAALAVAAPLATLASWRNALVDPFVILLVRDVTVFGGAVVVTVGGCVALPLLARWARLPRPLAVLLFLWLAACAWQAVESLRYYLDGPWTY